MATLATLFDASEQELGDLLGDTSILVKVQELVLEMFNCGDVRAQGIHTELVEKYGAFALPGIISASYIESDRKSNAKTVTRISSLVRDVIKDNDAAQLMVFRDGIIRNPFPKSHPIFIQALLEHRFLPNPGEYQLINTALQQAEQSNNTQRMLSIYQFLVAVDSHAITRATEQCAQWLRKDYGDIAAKLATTILKQYPDRTAYVVEKLFAQSYDRSSSIYSDISQHVHLANEQAALEAMHVLINYLLLHGQRNTAIEHFFDGPIARFIKTPQFLDAAHAMVEQSNSENVYGYWWRAVGRMTREQIVIDYMTTRLMQFCATNPDFAKAGVMQLMLLERRNPNLNWIVYYVELIAEQYSSVYADADTIAQKIMNAPRRERRERPALGTTTIRRDIPNVVDDVTESE